MTIYLNKYQPPPALPPVTEESELFESVSAELYDLNSFLPVPGTYLGTEKIRLEPLIVSDLRLAFLNPDWPNKESIRKPSVHGDALASAFSTPSSDPDEIWFYP